MLKKKCFMIALFFTILFTNCFFNDYLVKAKETINTNLLFEQAKEAYYKGDLAQAEKGYTSILKIESNNLLVLKNLFFIEKERGKFKEALKYIERINLLSDDLYLQYKYGVFLYQLGRYSDAKSILDDTYREIENRPDVFTTKEKSLLVYYLGQTYYKLKDIKKAENYLQQGININPTITINYLALGDLLQEQNRVEEAIKIYSAALKKDSSLSNIYSVLAKNYTEIDNDKAAYYYWNKSLMTNNKTNLAKINLDIIKKKHPEYLVEEKEQIAKKREQINWINITSLENKKEIPLIRVGLLDNVSVIHLQAKKPFQVINKDTNQIVFTADAQTAWLIQYKEKEYQFSTGNKKVKVITAEDGLLLKPIADNSTFVLYDITYGKGYFWAGYEDRQYRGELELYPIDKNSFNVINNINIEEYLFSVVPAEMPAWWPKEALKAQAIATRSYVFSHLNRHESKGYDVCSTVHCQVYSGVKSENKRTTEAVLDTRGEVAFYYDSIIDSVFSSNSGGYSESSADIWGNNYPYLSGANNMLENEYDFPLEPYLLEKWLVDEPNSYGNISKFAGYQNYRWIKILDKEYFLGKYDLKDLLDIVPIGRSKGGSIEKVVIKGLNKKVEIKKDYLRSGLGGLKSNRFTMDKIYDSNGSLLKVIIYGSGWGHNVGMDQTAAAGMAENNFNYEEILKHFYQDIHLKKIY